MGLSGKNQLIFSRFFLEHLQNTPDINLIISYYRNNPIYILNSITLNIGKTKSRLHQAIALLD
ncbi:hypothetical protein DRF65_07875 [Chryseobacterium pennae]|uniref:Uncharacterized protein n=1 Tax=Chryseobacterium pennae TaxID=2258962 RepID=A0A3D9CCD5_9FLAO|nr:hypothetical protein DRF65_07875 [Chryseobacterium pennae]